MKTLIKAAITFTAIGVAVKVCRSKKILTIDSTGLAEVIHEAIGDISQAKPKK